MAAIMDKDAGQLTAVRTPTKCAETAEAQEDGWRELQAELDIWAGLDRTATFWWRDDDAQAQTPALDRLIALHAATGAPLSLAVVPWRIDPGLIAALAPHSRHITALQHGYAHDDHARAGEKKTELAASRPMPDILAELARGWQNLQALPSILPVMVPPWNRIAQHLVALLPEIGLTGLSTFGPRSHPRPTPLSVQANAHIDPIDWRKRRFAGTAISVRAAIAHLQGRRLHTVDADEPSGLLTHHLAMDEPAWRFVEHFIRRTKAHPAVRWLPGNEVFGSA